MGKFHHSKKHHGDKKKSSSLRLKYDLTQAGRRKLPEDFLYTQNHKSIWNSFSNFLDEKFAEEYLSEILDEDEVTRIKTAPVIPPMLQFEPQNPGEEESEEAKRARQRGQSIADKSYAGREAQYFDGIKRQAPRPRNQVSKASPILQRTMGSPFITRCREDQGRSYEYYAEDGASTSRLSTTSLDLSSQRSSGTPTMPSSMVQLPQPHILPGQHPQLQSRSTPHTLSPVSKPTMPETHSSHMVGQRSTTSQPMPS